MFYIWKKYNMRKDWAAKRSYHAGVLLRIRLIRLRRSMASLNSAKLGRFDVKESMTRAAAVAISRGPRCALCAIPRRVNPLREKSSLVDSLRLINTATQTARDVVQFFMTLEMRRRMQQRLWRLHGAGCATQRGDDKLLGIIAVMCVGALTTQFRRCFIYHGISRCINIYPLAIYTGR